MSSIFIVAGEASGDHHAAGLVREIREQHPETRFAGLGGEMMAAEGVELFEDLVDRSVMGLRKVIAALGSMVEISARFVEALDERRPDAVILVDYPGLNLNLARIVRERRIPVIYYICPQVWAWAPWRVRRIAARVDRLLVILPFEAPLYRRYHNDTHYVGNPVFDRLAEIESAPRSEAFPEKGAKPILALFPGSRRQEVEEALPALLSTAEGLAAKHELEVVVSCQRERLRPMIGAAMNRASVECRLHFGRSHELQRAAHLSLVVSGTASLEQAFFATPMVVVYPVRAWERWAFARLSITPYIALANLFAGEALVPEILFAKGEEPKILEAAAPLWEGPEREALRERMLRVKRERLRPGATARAARRVVDLVRG